MWHSIQLVWEYYRLGLLGEFWYILNQVDTQKSTKKLYLPRYLFSICRQISNVSYSSYKSAEVSINPFHSTTICLLFLNNCPKRKSYLKKYLRGYLVRVFRRKCLLTFRVERTSRAFIRQLKESQSDVLRVYFRRLIYLCFVPLPFCLSSFHDGPSRA